LILLLSQTKKWKKNNPCSYQHNLLYLLAIITDYIYQGKIFRCLEMRKITFLIVKMRFDENIL